MLWGCRAAHKLLGTEVLDLKRVYVLTGIIRDNDGIDPVFLGELEHCMLLAIEEQGFLNERQYRSAVQALKAMQLQAAERKQP